MKMLSLLHRFRRDRKGATVVVFMGTLLGMLGSAAMVIDVGNVYVARRALQSSTDSAALAGASEINCCSAQPGKALTTATAYSAASGQANASARWAVTMASGFPQFRCLATIGVPCGGSDSANAIVVSQSAVVPTYFAALFGLTTWTVNVTSTASLAGGTPTPVDMMVIVDTTGSMNTADPQCDVANQSRLGCAMAGGRNLLSGLAPSAQQTGLMVFPGTATAADAAKNYDCSTSSPTITKYSANPVYSILGLGSDFRTSDGATSLNTSSNIVKAFKGGAAGCQQGMSAVGGVGTYYADVLAQAQASLVANGRANVQKAIILLSDGDATASSSNIAPAKFANQCSQAVAVAAAAKAAGTKIYTVAYGAPTSATGSCQSETVAMSACTTLKNIASDASTFYSSSDGSGGTCGSTNPATGLSSILGNIALQFRKTRLLPNNTV